MPKSLSTVLLQEKNKMASGSPWLVLLDIELNASYKFYFVSNSENVTFAGHVYTAFPFNVEPTKETSSGEMPMVTITVANVTQLIHYYLEQLDGGVGGRVTIRIVHHGNLTQDFSDLTMKLRILATQADAEWITFVCGAPNPLREQYPEFSFFAQHCNWSRRLQFKGLECAYAGVQTVCDGSWERCEELHNTTRFGGHRGLSVKGWRIA